MPKKVAVGGTSPKTLPFTPCIKYGNLLFVSGQGPIGRDGKVVAGDVKVQTRQTLDNFRRVLGEAGASMDDVLQTNVYLIDLNDFQAMNEVYTTYFHDPKPARTTVKAELVFGMKVEIQGIAAISTEE